jgi:hypothetical protein
LRGRCRGRDRERKRDRETERQRCWLASHTAPVLVAVYLGFLALCFVRERGC